MARLCLFATHGGRPDPSLMEALARQHDTLVVLTTTALQVPAPAGATVVPCENRNLDFGMHGRWLLSADLAGVRLLTLANDSCDLVPGRVLPYVAECEGWVLGLVKSYEVAEHLQGFHVVMASPAAVASAVDFFRGRRALLAEPLSKDAVIHAFEVGLCVHLRAHGFRLHAAYDPAGLAADMAAARAASPRLAPANLSYSYADVLLARGCPLLKRNRQMH